MSQLYIVPEHFEERLVHESPTWHPQKPELPVTLVGATDVYDPYGVNDKNVELPFYADDTCQLPQAWMWLDHLYCWLPLYAGKDA